MRRGSNAELAVTAVPAHRAEWRPMQLSGANDRGSLRADLRLEVARQLVIAAVGRVHAGMERVAFDLLHLDDAFGEDDVLAGGRHDGDRARAREIEETELQ